MTGHSKTVGTWSAPGWVPIGVWHYLEHIEGGRSIRELARAEGCHASTLLRRIRRFERRREDPLIDQALSDLGRASMAKRPPPPARMQSTEGSSMTAAFNPRSLIVDEETLNREARRILRRLSESGAVLAVAQDMEKAAVLRTLDKDKPATRTAVVDRPVAQAFALKDWISCSKPGRVAQYRITTAGKAALKRLLADRGPQVAGFAEAQSPFAAQHRAFGDRKVDEDGESRRLRANLAESPVTALARRRDKDGQAFLAPDLVAAAERLREDFELAQMGPRVAQNWERFLTGGGRSGHGSSDPIGGPQGARDRVALALRDLGPGLGDMALRCCCFLEGLEATEKRMGWSARSGKIVLRIALMRLARHYEDTYGKGGGMIG